MTINDLSGDELRAALLRTASGVYATEAAIRLLLAHGSWPLRLDGAGLLTVSEATTAAGSASCYAEVLWEEVSANIDAGHLLIGSGSEIRVLRIAASLAAGIPVDLADAVTGLDRHNLALVLAALSHACRDAVKIVRHPGVQIEQTGPRDDRVQSWPHQACWS